MKAYFYTALSILPIHFKSTESVGSKTFARVTTAQLSMEEWAKTFFPRQSHIKTRAQCSARCKINTACTHYSWGDGDCALGNANLDNNNHLTGAEVGDIYMESGRPKSFMSCYLGSK